jgi:hypothetical protein
LRWQEIGVGLGSRPTEAIRWLRTKVLPKATLLGDHPLPLGLYDADMGPARHPTYRVDHYEQGTVHELGRLVDVPPHRRTLDPFVSHLLRRGLDGERVQVDEESGAIVTRRAVRPFKHQLDGSIDHRGRSPDPDATSRAGPTR